MFGESESRRRTDGSRFLPNRRTCVYSSSRDAHVANGSSRSPQAMAVVFSAAAASNGSLGFTVGSSNRFSSCSVTLSNIGPLCLLDVLGATDEVSSLK